MNEHFYNPWVVDNRSFPNINNAETVDELRVEFFANRAIMIMNTVCYFLSNLL